MFNWENVNRKKACSVHIGINVEWHPESKKKLIKLKAAKVRKQKKNVYVEKKWPWKN